MSELSEVLERKWGATCRLVFGQPVGPLEDYALWLSEMADPVFSRRSTLSGREVSFSVDDYAPSARAMGFEENDFGAKFEPIQINDIKDIDSLARAVSERAVYTGNIVLGNSKYVEKSSNVSDSFYVSFSSQMGDSKYAAYDSMGRLCDSVFGCAMPGDSEYIVRCNDTYKTRRFFEIWMTANSSDCHYSFALNNCSECIFCFNSRSTRHAIGNTKLPKEKYSEIKARLLEQMREELLAKKRLPSLLEIVAKAKDTSRDDRALLEGKFTLLAREKTDMAPMEEAFARASSIVLGKELRGISAYSPWLNSHVKKGEKRKSVLTGREIFVGGYANYLDIPKGRTVLEDEAFRLDELRPKIEGLEGITLQNAHTLIGRAAYFALEFQAAASRNMVDCMAYANSANCYSTSPCNETKDSAVDFWPRSSEHVFGCSIIFDSSFCVKCYNSQKLARCFECDSCNSSSGCYYCHNVENCQDCMFCFNVKNLKYAVGNVEVGREEYARIKKMALEEIGRKLAKDKKLGVSIYDIGARK
jgi:hypothetical protein